MQNSMNGFLFVFSSPLSIHVNFQNKAAYLLSPVSCGVCWTKARFIPLGCVFRRVINPKNLTQATCAPVPAHPEASLPPALAPLIKVLLYLLAWSCFSLTSCPTFSSLPWWFLEVFLVSSTAPFSLCPDILSYFRGNLLHVSIFTPSICQGEMF